MAKKDLQAAAAHGADLFFSAAGAHEAQNTEYAQHTQNAVIPHRAQDEEPAQLAETVEEMQQAIITQEQERAQRKEARKAETAARHSSKKRFNAELNADSYDYLAVMAGITGVSVNRFLSDLVDREAATNNETYLKAKELIRNARKQ